MFANKLAASLLALAAAAVASPTAFIPVAPKEDIVFSPHITGPTAGQLWPVGTNQTVTWDTSSIPAEGQNQTGLLLLGYQENDSENLDISHPLAVGFPISAGEVNITVPNVTMRTDYIVVLFGDSGNVSPQFTIAF
ncbi:hypothetical protein CERSUDRAFT_89078 [Gelatoporia subvermispora B]|uniref:Yeast cell wall synthesis Kre9/Knh1-like N-terminal domain-containing protein n=1 Tax=Ceriporiopsis subvermispora (strain B) TaxID=914234 RepID=M2QH73_CERS8|nr:hypothetical protein CERSUDRAFT_89078 [Gelatoporia subvermispora B]